MWIEVKLNIIGYSTLDSSFFTPNAVAKCSTPLNSWRLIWSAIPIQQMQQTKWTTLFCGARRNRIRSLRWFIHLQFMKCLREINSEEPGLLLSPALGIIKSFYEHTWQDRLHRSDGGSHQRNEWRVTQKHLHWRSQNFAPHLLSLHLWFECRQHMQRVTSDFSSAFINSLACARHQQVQESQHGSAPVETQRTRKRKHSAL